MTHLQVDADLTASIKQGYLQDKQFLDPNNPPAGAELDAGSGLYWIADKLYVPNVSTIKTRIMEEYHTCTGHADANKTAACSKRSFYWPSINKDIKSYIKLCQLCQKIKPRTAKPYGSSMPLPVPNTLLQLSPCPPVHGVSLFYLYLIRTGSMMSEISARGPQSVGLSLKAIHCGLGL